MPCPWRDFNSRCVILSQLLCLVIHSGSCCEAKNLKIGYLRTMHVWTESNGEVYVMNVATFWDIVPFWERSHGSNCSSYVRSAIFIVATWPEHSGLPNGNTATHPLHERPFSGPTQIFHVWYHTSISLEGLGKITILPTVKMASSIFHFSHWKLNRPGIASFTC
jgi:hypothetical protein